MLTLCLLKKHVYMGTINLTGVGVALVTPFQGDGNVDYAALARLVDLQLQSRVDYIVALGTTAETPTLSRTEKEMVVQLVKSQTAGAVPVVMGVGRNSTQAVVNRLLEDNFDGIDALLVVTPYYNKPNQEGLYQHFKTVAQSSPRPILLYNVPGRTGVNMTAETTLKLAHDFPQIVAIKEASGNLEQISTIIKDKPKGFQVISGDDPMTFRLIKAGATGVISVIANAFPAQTRRMVHLALEQKWAEAEEADRHFHELYRLLFAEGSPAGVKSMLHQMGYIKPVLRLPLTPVSAKTAEEVTHALNVFQNT
jgi:4-hydroxy-tetrahydrodipicolinate synthase